MSKFIKRIRKIKKNLENCLLIGTNFGYLEEFCDAFVNVFSLIVENNLPKKRNLIHRQDFKELSLIPTIDFVFVDFQHLEKVCEIENVLTRFRCAVYINHGEFLDAKYSKFFGKVGYQITHIEKSYQIWTPK
jgi:hypothetical protein